MSFWQKFKTFNDPGGAAIQHSGNFSPATAKLLDPMGQAILGGPETQGVNPGYAAMAQAPSANMGMQGMQGMQAPGMGADMGQGVYSRMMQGMK